jgi:probable addiction module antidote protein
MALGDRKKKMETVSIRPGTVTTQFDAANYIESLEDAADYLNIALEAGDADEVADAVGVICRALTRSDEGGLKALAEAVGLSRSALYQSFTLGGNPRLKTLLVLMNHLGIGFRALPIDSGEASTALEAV